MEATEIALQHKIAEMVKAVLQCTSLFLVMANLRALHDDIKTPTTAAYCRMADRGTTIQ